MSVTTLVLTVVSGPNTRWSFFSRAGLKGGRGEVTPSTEYSTVHVRISRESYETQHEKLYPTVRAK